MQPPRIAHRVRAGAAVGAAALLLVACGGGGDDDAAGPTAATFETVAPTEPLFTRTTDDATTGSGPADASTAVPADSTGGSTEPPGDATVTSRPADDPAGTTGSAADTTLPTVPDTGVPGLDSTDAFCRAWSQFAGTFQALAGVSMFGDATEAGRSEVAASGALLGAIADLDANLPAELEAERADLATRTGGLGGRAAAARDELLAAGLSQADVDALGQAWIDALAAAGLDDPTVSIEVPAGIDATAFDRAVDAFIAAKPALTDDPSLIIDVDVPLTDEYLFDNCPDQGTLAGNDVIG